MNTEQSFLQELLIVIVVFEKKPLETSAFQSLNSIREEALLMIYDNSSLPSHVEVENTIYLHDASNPGVSKAYNTASTLAKSRNKKWLMLADQDTSFPESLFEKYQMAITDSSSKLIVPLLTDHLGLVSPFRFSKGKGRRIQSIKAGTLELSSFRFANSGVLIALDTFN
ncbi:MAG TPA: hypothetical protein VFE57_12005, partial [Cyclobacteriaceae bacterium]|nr:hypothetical protein [Cyclobacteriaceae bacterium]